MHIRELVSQFSSSYKIESSSSVSGNTRTTTRTLVFTGKNLPQSVSFEYNRMIREIELEAQSSGDLFSVYSKYGLNYKEQLFLSILLDKGLLKKHEVEKFRQAIYNRKRLPVRILMVGWTLFFVIMIIVAMAT